MPNSVTGTITTSSSTVVLPNTFGDTSAYISINGTYAGVTVNFEVSLDGATYYPAFAIRADTGVAEISEVLSANASAIWGVNIAPMASFRVRASAYTSGTASVTIMSGPWQLPLGVAASPASTVTVGSALPTGANTIGNVGISGAIPTGANTIGTVNIGTLPTVLIGAQNAGAVLNQASGAQTASGQSANLSVNGYSKLFIGINVSVVSGTSPTCVFGVDSLGLDANWYNIWSSTKQYAVGSVITSIGSGLQVNSAFGATIRFKWTIGGTTPSFTFSASIQGK